MPNLFDLFKNTQAIQEETKKLQSEMENLTAEGSSGGRMVTVKINGKFELLEIHLDPLCVDNRDIKMLEDLIIAAQHDAVSKIQEALSQKSRSIFSGLTGMNIPGV